MPRKSGTGCVTCRIRRVKCDEAKPCCQRCITSKRQCDGYLPGDSTVTRRQLVEAVRELGVIGPVSKALTQYPGQRLSPSQVDSLSLFDVFRKLTAPSTASFLPSNFWTGELLQLAHSEPAVWHATLALGALHQKHELASQGAGMDHRVDVFQRLANQNYAQAVTHAQALRDPHRLLSLSLALVSITNMMGRWSESQVHITAGHRLMLQAKGHPAVKLAAEMLMRLDLQALTFSESSAPYPYEEAPDMTDITKCMRAAAIENYEQAGTALFSLVRRFLLADEAVGMCTVEQVNEKLAMRDILQDLVDWEFKMAIFEKDGPTGEPAAMSVRLYHALLRGMLAARRFGPDMRYDDLLGYFERIVACAESLLLAIAAREPRSPLSLEPGIIIPLFVVGSRCRHPVLRSRVIRLLRNINRQEGMWFSDGAAEVCAKTMTIEGQTILMGDLPPLAPIEDIPWEAWSMSRVQPQTSLSWEGIERVPEIMRVRETLVLVTTEQRRIDVTFIMSSGDDIGSYGGTRSESVTY
ncbi:fungal-specific transcription factor domain-containing protein [Dactylonectria macrodidyma]|uniref:Fungal-specific transcription factor domain-containing protein n=1 Tax=Dactylonectria macrodidyma TaxID=307937 RepID=A0A9P9ERI9_9HYPO|nr:fungal-specific transcription factor domain-containing protein [Dactylonectria macrodidyma]